MISTIEELWCRKSIDQILYAVDICRIRSCCAQSIWARKHWHNVAARLVEKYVG